MMPEDQLYSDKVGSTALPNDLFAEIVKSTKDAIVSANLEGVITSWNPSAEQLFGYSAAEAVDKNINIITPPELEEDQRLISIQVQTGQLVKHYKTVRKSKDGQYIDINVTLSPICDAAGRIIGTSRIMQDITVQGIIDAHLQTYLKALEESNRDLQSFAHITSHDLREPLRGLSSLSSFLLEDYKDKLDANGIKMLNNLVSLCDSMDNLIINLLYFSELENEKTAVQETDINEIVQEVQHMMEFLLKEKNAHIVIPCVLPTVICDKTRVTEVFRNLIINAVKHNDKKEPVVEVGFLKTMETQNGHEENVFYVKDNGIGIEPKYHQMIFTMFKRIPSAFSNERSGTGAGLAFAKKIIERHKGHIWLESEPGKGSTFYFTLNPKKAAHE